MGYELSKRDAKQVSAIEARAAIERAVIVSNEDLPACVVQRRIDNAYDLADYAFMRATRLNRQVTTISRDNPGLEMTGRQLEEVCGKGSIELLYRYMTRR